MRIEVIDMGIPIVTSAEIMKVKGGIYRLILESDNSRIALTGYRLGVPSSMHFEAGRHEFKVVIEGLPNGQYLVLPDKCNNTFYLIDEHKFNDNNPKKAVWTNGT